MLQSRDTSAEAEDPAEEAGRKEEVGDYSSMTESKRERIQQEAGDAVMMGYIMFEYLTLMAYCVTNG